MVTLLRRLARFPFLGLIFRRAFDLSLQELQSSSPLLAVELEGGGHSARSLAGDALRTCVLHPSGWLV